MPLFLLRRLLLAQAERVWWGVSGSISLRTEGGRAWREGGGRGARGGRGRGWGGQANKAVLLGTQTAHIGVILSGVNFLFHHVRGLSHFSFISVRIALRKDVFYMYM